MSTLFKKYFWAIQLTALALLAMLAAGAINDWVGSKLFVKPKPPAAGAANQTGDHLTDALGRVAADNAAASLSERRVFNLDPTEAVIEVKPPVDPPDDEEVVVDPDGELEESKLPIDLVGTLVAADAESSVATLLIEGSNKLGWVGSSFLDSKAEIVRIGPRHVVLREERTLTVIRLWDEKGAGSKAPRPGRSPVAGISRPTSTRPPPAVSTRQPTSDAVGRTQRANRIREGVKKTGAYDYQVSRSMIDEELKDLGRLQSEARVVPHYKNQKYEGFKLVGVRPGSLYRALGIRSGDVITGVNGTQIDSPTKALSLFEQLKSSSDIKVEIERRGQPKTLGFNIQ